MARTTMIGALARGCQAARIARGLSPAAIAAMAGVSEGVVRRFERGRTWPKKIEAVVDAYARAIGKPAWELWGEAAITVRG